MQRVYVRTRILWRCSYLNIRNGLCNIVVAITPPAPLAAGRPAAVHASGSGVRTNSSVCSSRFRAQIFETGAAAVTRRKASVRNSAWKKKSRCCYARHVSCNIVRGGADIRARNAACCTRFLRFLLSAMQTARGGGGWGERCRQKIKRYTYRRTAAVQLFR